MRSFCPFKLPFKSQDKISPPFGGAAVVLESFDGFDTDTFIGDLNWEEISSPVGVVLNNYTDDFTEGTESLQIEYTVTDPGGGFFGIANPFGAPNFTDVSGYKRVAIDIIVRAIPATDMIHFWVNPDAGDRYGGSTPAGKTGRFTVIVNLAPGEELVWFQISNDEGYLNEQNDVFDISIDNLRAIP